jgi:hypothetical protein
MAPIVHIGRVERLQDVADICTAIKEERSPSCLGFFTICIMESYGGCTRSQGKAQPLRAEEHYYVGRSSFDTLTLNWLTAIDGGLIGGAWMTLAVTLALFYKQLQATPWLSGSDSWGTKDLRV